MVGASWDPITESNEVFSMTITITLLIFGGRPAIEPQNAETGFTLVVDGAVDEPEHAWLPVRESTTTRAVRPLGSIHVGGRRIISY